jgi:MoaA/NifB/PqqE/SkfB family radical SAM enzyme
VSTARQLLRMGSRLVRPVGAGPELLCQFVTARCDARCRHCFDHTRRGPEHVARELRLAELEAIAARLPPLYMVLLTGGEPFLRPDLPAIATAYARGPRPAVLAIPTNGGRPQAILAAVDSILTTLPRGTTLSVNVSIDGVGPLHDAIRGVPGLFERAMATAAGLRARARRDPRLVTGVISVVSQANAAGLEALETLLLDEVGIGSWAPFLLRGEPRDPALGEPAVDAYRQLADRLEQRAREGRWGDSSGFLGARVNGAKNAVRRRIIERTITSGQRQVPCRAGALSAVIQSDGTVQACELRDLPMGDLREHGWDLAKLWRAAEAQRARALVRGGACACTHENTLTVSVAWDWRSWGAMLGWLLTFSRAGSAGP